MLKHSVFERFKVGKVTCSSTSFMERKCCNNNTYAYLSHCRHNFSVKEYFDFMADIESRDSWDSSTKSVKIVEATENNKILPFITGRFTHPLGRLQIETMYAREKLKRYSMSEIPIN